MTKAESAASRTPRTIRELVLQHAALSGLVRGSTGDGLHLLELDGTGHYAAANIYLSALCVINDLQNEAADLRERLAKAREDKDMAYLERNHLVAALARLYPSGLRRTDIPGWSADWHGCCMIDLPTGQISYHYHDSHAHLFSGIPPYSGEWDGHDKETVHARLAALSQKGADHE